MGQRSDQAPAAVSFNENLTGHIAFDETGYEAAYRAGEAAGRRLALQLRITADDVDRFIADERYTARVAGWVRGDTLGGTLEVEDGSFNLVAGPDGGRRMDYRLCFHDGADRPLTLAGHKDGDRGTASALHVRLYAGHVEAGDDAPAIAAGILRMLPEDVATRLTTFRVSPPLRLDALARFGALVAGDLWESYR
jgi:cholesterol oxidase